MKNDKWIWTIEPNYRKWVDQDTGLHCVIVRHRDFLTLNGYVRVPRDHPLFDERYERVGANVHGGLTFEGRPRRFNGGYLRGYWFGFDTCHYEDFVPAFIDKKISVSDTIYNYRDWNYVKAEVISLASQLKEISNGR